VFDAQGRVVVPEYISVYYKGPGYAPDGRQVPVQSLPAGLRMIAGADPADHAAPSAHQWYCERTQQKSATIPSCPSGELVDSADHRSHLAYLRYDNGVRACPASHPVPLPEFTLGIWFQHEGDSASWYLASDRMPGMPVHPNGSSFHSDWFGAWHPAVQQTWIERCINGLLNCSGGQLGDGTELAAATDYVGPRRLAPPARP
jgi:hypothetical protein